MDTCSAKDVKLAGVSIERVIIETQSTRSNSSPFNCGHHVIGTNQIERFDRFIKAFPRVSR
jgi:hypothetical protein